MKKKQKKMLFRIIISALLLIAAVLMPEVCGVYKLLTFVASFLVAGYDIILKALRNIAHMQIFDENFLMLIASLGAFFIGEYPEAAAVALLYQVGELFQSYAVDKSRRSIKNLMNIKPDYANIEADGKMIKVDPESVKKDDIIVINAGERVPLDGIVTEGEAAIDTSAMTGESKPVSVKIGSSVTSGCICLNGMLKVKVKNEFSQSTVSKVLKLVEEAGSRKSKSENFITKFSKYYTPAVVICAAILGIVIPLCFPVPNKREWVERALIFLVVSCPCALIISVPLSFFSGIGASSKRGILVKGSQYIEALSKADTVIFDKTGTLTEGKYAVSEIITENYDENEVLRLAAMAEFHSNHPVAQALKKASGEERLTSEIKNFKELSGMGITADIDGKSIAVGNAKLFSYLNIPLPSHDSVGTDVNVSENGKYIGSIIIEDKLKPDAPRAVSLLKESGVRKTVLLTGDKKETGERVGKAVGADEIHCGLLPQDKVKYVSKLKNDVPKGRKLLFVGDGINDAPSLAYADVGVAMGAIGSDAAIEAADVVIMDDDLKSLSKAIKISKKTILIANENIAFALGVKFFFLITGALGITNLWGAVFADVGVAMIAVLNAFRAMKYNPQSKE